MTTKKLISQAYLWLILLVLYAPIVFIAIFSFTNAKSLGNWTGFTLDIYKSFFTVSNSAAESLMDALKSTLIIAVIASAASTLLGTLAAIGIFNLRGRKDHTVPEQYPYAESGYYYRCLPLPSLRFHPRDQGLCYSDIVTYNLLYPLRGT